MYFSADTKEGRRIKSLKELNGLLKIKWSTIIIRGERKKKS